MSVWASGTNVAQEPQCEKQAVLHKGVASGTGCGGACPYNDAFGRKLLAVARKPTAS